MSKNILLKHSHTDNPEILEIGLDEAGRGALAGPVTVAACVMPYGFTHELIKDSKLLKEDQRVEARQLVLDNCLAYSIQHVDVKDIEMDIEEYVSEEDEKEPIIVYTDGACSNNGRSNTRAVSRIALGLQDKVYLGNLDSKRDWGHAKDYVRMMWMILQAEESEDWVIATGKTTKIRDFVKMAFKVLGIELDFVGKGINEKAFVKSCSNKKYEIKNE
jgi:hypothetical protein